MVLFDMILYTVPIAPNPTKVMLYIAERHIRGIDMGRGQRQKAAHLPRHAIQKPAAAHVRKQRNRDFGHADARALTDHR